MGRGHFGSIHFVSDFRLLAQGGILPYFIHISENVCLFQLIRGPLTADSLDSVRGSSSFCGSSSLRSGPTNGNVNLSSPESAYSTGYSTDGTSPGASYPAGASYPPEYYINLRTGTHYFQSAPPLPVPVPLPTATGPAPGPASGPAPAAATFRPGWVSPHS